MSFTAWADGLNLGGAFSLGSWSAQATQYRFNRSVCAWSTTPDSLYRVIASTQGSTERFALRGDLGDLIRFDILWRDNAIAASWERLIPRLPSTLRYRFDRSANCFGNNTQFQIRLSKIDADAAPGGLYSGTLTIILVAE